jgi:hypothetical protein
MPMLSEEFTNKSKIMNLLPYIIFHDINIYYIYNNNQVIIDDRCTLAGLTLQKNVRYVVKTKNIYTFTVNRSYMYTGREVQPISSD